MFLRFSRYVRNQIIFANTMFKVVCYRPDESQIVTAGTDKNVSDLNPQNYSSSVILVAYDKVLAIGG